MTLVDRIDGFGKPGWIAITVVSFIIFWPIGFVVLGFLLGSGRMGCWHHYSNANGGDRWQRRMDRSMQRGIDRMQEGLQRMQAAAERRRLAAYGLPFSFRPSCCLGHYPATGGDTKQDNLTRMRIFRERGIARTV